jgi:hypothetical protein
MSDRPLADLVVQAMTGLWPEEFPAAHDRQAWIDNANKAIAVVTRYMRDNQEATNG